MCCGEIIFGGCFKMKKKLLSILLVLVLCIGMIPNTVSAASAVNVSSSSKTYYYTLKNVGTGKYLNVSCNSSANNTNINVWAKDGTSGENFAFYTDSKNNAYVIVPECSTSRAVNIYGSSAGANKNVCTWTKTGDSTQGWVLKSVSGGYVIQSANNKNYVLTATGSSNGSNVNIQKYSSSNKNQVWTLTQTKTVTAKTTTSGSSSSSSKSKTLITDTNLKLIQTTGLQPNAYACGCVALAYCRDIIDKSQHYYTEYEYGAGSNCAWWYAAGYTPCTSSSEQTVYKAIYDQINAGKPVVVYVTGGRSTGSHYIAIVGYTGVTNVNNLSASNFLVVDSVDGDTTPYSGTPKVENLGTIDYSLKKSGGVYYYYKYTGK